MLNEKNKRLVANISFLGVLQIFNYGLPLMLIPYLIETLSKETYGVIILSQSLVLYFSILVDYGFTLSATRDVAVSKANKEKLSEIFSSVMLIKGILLIISFVIFGLIVTFVERFNNYQELYYFGFIAVIGQVLFPVWYFQGIEDMKIITIINIISKTFFTIITFIFVQSESDYLLVPLFYSLGFLFSGLWAQYYIYTKYNEKIRFKSFRVLKKYFLSSSQFFLARMSSSGYSNTNIFLVGMLLPSQFVTYYYLSDKVIQVTLSIFNPIQQAIYPYLSSKFNNRIFIYSTIIIFVSALMGVIVISFLDSYISQVLLGEINNSFKDSLGLLLYVIPISIAYVMLGAPLLLAKGYLKEFNKSIIYGFVVHLFLLSIVYSFSKNIKSSDDVLHIFICSLLFSKFLVLLLRSYYVCKNKILREMIT